MARFQRSLVGAVSLIVTTDPAAPAGAVRRCDQNVSPTEVSTHWLTTDWPDPTVRATELSQSLATANTREPARVVVSDALGAPEAALAAWTAPMPEVAWKATTVSNWWKPALASVDDTVTPVSLAAAVAIHTSDVPNCVLARVTRVHVRPAPDTVTVCEPAVVGPSAATKAIRVSPAWAVVKAAVVAVVPVPLTDTCVSTTGDTGATGADGVTAPDGVEATPDPMALAAVTVNV